MSAKSLSAKITNYTSSLGLGSGAGSSVMDMVLMGAGVIIIILLLVYIYNRFIYKQHAKNEYFEPTMDSPVCNCGKQMNDSEISCVNCQYGVSTDGKCIDNKNKQINSPLPSMSNTQQNTDIL